MKKNVIGTITDHTGHTTDIVDGEHYTVIYQEDGKMKIQQGCYHNYPADQYIGKDDEEGWSHGARVFFNGGRANDMGVGGVIPIVVTTDKAFAAKIKKTFGF